MAPFSHKAERLDPYKSFKFRVKWGDRSEREGWAGQE